MQLNQQIVFSDRTVEWGSLVDPSALEKLQRRAGPASILAWRCGRFQHNFKWFGTAVSAKLPALPLRFDLERDLSVLGEWHLQEKLEEQVWLVEAPDLKPALQDCFYLNLSSGTSASRTIAFPGWSHLRANAQANLRFFCWSQQDEYWCTFPFYAHAHELFSKSVLMGKPILALQTTELETINQRLRDPKKNVHILTTPHVATAFLARHLKPQSPHQIRFELAGEYVAPGVVRRLQAQGFQAYISWGSAETSGVAVADVNPRRAGSIGQPLPGYQLGTLAMNEEMNLHLEGEPIPPYLASNGLLQQTFGRFTAKDLVIWDGDTLLFKGRSDQFLKFHGTYIDCAMIELWAKSFEGVDNAFLSLWEQADQTVLVLFIQCPERAHWASIQAGLTQRMVEQYGHIRLQIECASMLAHTPTGKLIRDAQHQFQNMRGD